MYAKKFITPALLSIVMLKTVAQTDSTSNQFKLSGTVTITNNGISLIPTYSLDKPAVLAFFKLKKGRFSYEPDVEFSYNGRPWGMGHAFRYVAINNKKFTLKTGTVLGIAFSYPEVLQDSKMVTVNKAERYIWLELVPSYNFSDKFSFSSTIWNGHNLEKNSAGVINFISFSASINNININKSLYCSFFPQVFYLNVDNKDDGIFFSGVAGIGHKKLPLFLSGQVTTTFTTNIHPDPGFKWNASLTYIF